MPKIFNSSPKTATRNSLKPLNHVSKVAQFSVKTADLATLPKGDSTMFQFKTDVDFARPSHIFAMSINKFGAFRTLHFDQFLQLAKSRQSFRQRTAYFFFLGGGGIKQWLHAHLGNFAERRFYNMSAEFYQKYPGLVVNSMTNFSSVQRNWPSRRCWI